MTIFEHTAQIGERDCYLRHVCSRPEAVVAYSRFRLQGLVAVVHLLSLAKLRGLLYLAADGPLLDGIRRAQAASRRPASDRH